MAINPETQYPGKIAPSTPDYPYGAARNVTLPGDGTGTPWEAALVNDIFGWQQALLAEAAIVPSGTPEKATASQYLTAMRQVLGALGIATFNNVSDMAAGTPSAGGSYTFKAGQLLATQGRDSVNDGYGAMYYVKTGTADGQRTIDLGGGFIADPLENEGKFSLGLAGGLVDPQAAFDAIQTAATQGEKLTIGKGTFAGNFETGKTPIEGVGASTVLQPVGSSPALTLKRHTPDWDYYLVENLTIDGISKNAIGAQFDPGNPFAGRWAFKNVFFRNCTRGVDKPTGNIGDSYTDCTWNGCDYGFRSTSDPQMHGGAITMQRSHMDGIASACFFSDDDLDGSGGYVIRDTIFEQCDGFGVYLDLGNKVPYTPPTVQNLWLEKVAKAATVDIDGNTVVPRELYYKDVPYAVVKETYFHNIELINSTVHAENCRIDNAATLDIDILIDSDSQLIVDNVYANGTIGGEAFVRSIGRQLGTSNTFNYSVRGPLMTSQVPAANVGNATNVVSNSYSGVGPWLFSGTTSRNANSVSDGVLNATCAELLINDGETLIGNPGTPTPGKWAVWGIHAKLVSGAIGSSRIGFNWNAGDVYLRLGQWVRSYGMQKVGGTVADCRLAFINSSGAPATVRFADFFLIEFDTFEEAIEFCNSGTSYKNEI